MRTKSRTRSPAHHLTPKISLKLLQGEFPILSSTALATLVRYVQSLIIQFSSGEESLGRYLALVSSIGSWLGGVEWKKYGDFSHHLTLPGSGLPIYLNGTSATFNAVLGNLAAVGLSKSGWTFFQR